MKIASESLVVNVNLFFFKSGWEGWGVNFQEKTIHYSLPILDMPKGNQQVKKQLIAREGERKDYKKSLTSRKELWNGKKKGGGEL